MEKTKQYKYVILIVILILGLAFYWFELQPAQIRKECAREGISLSLTPSHKVIAENDPKILALKQSLPRFEDSPAKVYSIPPKPKLVHESNPYGMRYWTLTENWVDSASSYNMGGHYLMNRYATGNPDLLIIDGLTGQVFHENGSLYFSSVANSSLVIFDPIDVKCFSSNGDYKPCYEGEKNPQYVIWDGKQFNTICEPIVKAWKLVSCGEFDNLKIEIN